jgi:hypothetical protein
MASTAHIALKNRLSLALEGGLLQPEEALALYDEPADSEAYGLAYS